MEVGIQDNNVVLVIRVNHNLSKARNHTEANLVKQKSVVGELPGIPTTQTICSFALPAFSLFQFNHSLNPLLHSTHHYSSSIITHLQTKRRVSSDSDPNPNSWYALSIIV